MPLDLWLIDAFTDRPFAGNPAGVCLLAAPKPDEWMQALAPDWRLLRAVETRGVIVTAPSDVPDVDFISRFFAPGAGVDEDPVTGSAHCALAPYWAARLGRKTLIGFQASARGGTVRVEDAGERVLLGGKAVTVLKGEFREPRASPR